MGPAIVHVALAYVLGVVLGYVLRDPGALQASLVVVAALMWRPRPGAAVLSAGLAVGMLAGSLAVRRARSCDVLPVGPLAIVLRVHDAPGPRGVTDGRVVHAVPLCTGVLRIRLPDRVGAGSTMIVVGRYRGRGVFVAHHMRVLERRAPLRFRLRAAISARVEQLYGRRAGIIDALVIGRRQDVDPAVRRDFAGSGLAHLLAISGLHVGILAGWLGLGLSVLPSRRWRIWSLLGGVWGYVGLLGLPPPATRAAAFITVHQVARLLQRHPPPAAVLAVAALAVVSVNPAAVASVGAWLSFAAVWGTSAAVRLVPRSLRRNAPVTLLASSVGATVATAPITALAFGTVAPIGVAANLVAIPLASLVVPAVLVSLVAGGGMAAGAGLLLGAVEWVAHTAARVPGGQWSGVAGLRGALPWAAVLAAVVWLAHARPTWARLRWRLLSVGALSGWALLAVDLVRGEPSEGLSLHVLDVGQGDAIAVRTPRGRWLLVDAGPRTPDRDAGREVVAPFLRRRGVARLATLVVSHGDADHLGGAPAVVTAFAPELVLEPGQALPSRLYLDYLADVGAFGTAWRPARAGDTLVLDSVVVRVLHPSASWLEGQLGPNENSVVLHVQYGCFDAVLPGDAGSPVEAALVGRLAPVEVLKVGHHGSASGTTDAWLAALRPAVAVISVGRGNRYGHPAPSVLHRLALRGIAVFRTDRDGTVTIHTDGRYLEVRTGGPVHFAEGVVCRLQRLLRSSGSSLSRNGCTRAPRVSLPICSTTSP